MRTDISMYLNQLTRNRRKQVNSIVYSPLLLVCHSLYWNRLLYLLLEYSEERNVPVDLLGTTLQSRLTAV